MTLGSHIGKALLNPLNVHRPTGAGGETKKEDVGVSDYGRGARKGEKWHYLIESSRGFFLFRSLGIMRAGLVLDWYEISCSNTPGSSLNDRCGYFYLGITHIDPMQSMVSEQ